MNTMTTMAAGLSDNVHDTQQAFREVLDALSRPGQLHTLGTELANVSLGGAMARLLLSLCDDETPVWWQGDALELQNWLRFHTGASVAEEPKLASFAVFNQIEPGLTLENFSLGTAASPELSSTLLIELPALSGGPEVEWQGPGIANAQRVSLQGLPANFWKQWQSNHGHFPQGVDIIFTCGDSVLGLPRTTRVSQIEGV
jgi:alpha-D-ribose 1-methylphosphonate 5-triphosphate synthase subunit PhnH